MAAAVKGAGEIGFTILSISLSLVAVFIPLLLMGGLVGRLFREFSVTVAVTIAVSAFVSLTLTPMMCGASDAGRPGRPPWPPLPPVGSAPSTDSWPATSASLDLALRHHRLTFGVFVATVAATA